MRIIFCLLIGLLMCATAQAEQFNYPFTAPQDAQRFHALTQEIRCVVCQNQSIADSNAPLAHDLREKVYRMINEQQSDAEIKDYLVKRYGEFILLKPRLNQHTFLLWGFPVFALLLILFFIFCFIRKKSIRAQYSH